MNDKPLKDVSILLVEDNEMNTLLASAIIERTGANITEADNGMDAIQMLKSRAFDVILMDLHLPIMNGFETTKYIRETLSLSVPIIAITANVVNGEEKKCLEAGMNGFISKPYTEKGLIEKISQCVALKSRVTADEADDSFIVNSNNGALYNLSLLEDISKGNRTLIAQMVRVFVNQIPIAMFNIKTAYNNNNLSEVYSIAHSIKPNIDSLNIVSLKDNIRRIESFAGQGKNGNELKGLIGILDNTLLKVVHELQRKEL